MRDDGCAKSRSGRGLMSGGVRREAVSAKRAANEESRSRCPWGNRSRPAVCVPPPVWLLRRIERPGAARWSASRFRRRHSASPRPPLDSALALAHTSPRAISVGKCGRTGRARGNNPATRLKSGTGSERRRLDRGPAISAGAYCYGLRGPPIRLRPSSVLCMVERRCDPRATGGERDCRVNGDHRCGGGWDRTAGDWSHRLPAAPLLSRHRPDFLRASATSGGM